MCDSEHGPDTVRSDVPRKTTVNASSPRSLLHQNMMISLLLILESVLILNALTINKKRVPKFEFYVYNDVGNIVKQYLTTEQIQELLMGHGEPAGVW